jgi:Leucine-rich repeat (LRR) protein
MNVQELYDRETKRLDLSHQGLSELPEDVFKLSELEELDASYNSITSIPRS